ncbi:TonB-dependent receptor [Phenylobacterium sp. 58.2.17]|uniref:TonB-dependent receptor n=1 Tax=Phenylobacterium sp. 58.2.17 TaxID=2969306 RepID=UPI0022651144|nr:TonB-dependent receptor [Phenylobacterium sp. 58.2.17]MCX7587273.1 TonB-dependent receptor [Phenylobacterium sp. 58.2.17]
MTAPHELLLNASALGLLTALSVLPAHALAQSTSSTATLEEVVVTAEKRETNLQDTPVSITAVTGETLQAMGVATIEDLQLFTPGVTITNDSMAIVNIRGIGTSAFGVATDPSSTVHYDGVYIPRPTTGYQDMFDVERVELLRGPQGVLFGRNSAGGTLNITSKAPTRALEGVLSATLGNYDRRTFSGTVSGPLGERVRGRLTLMKNDRDGIYANPKTGETYQNQNRFAARGAVEFDVTEALELVLRADYGRDRETGYPSVRLSYPPQFAAAGATIPTGEDQLILDTRPRNNVENGGVSATATYVTAPLTFKSITAYRASTIDQVLDVDATDLFLRNLTLWERSRSFTQELQVSNNDAERLEWIVGAFYLRETARDQLQILEPGRTLALPEANVTNAAALYGQATYEVMDRLRLTGGLRYSYEKKDFNYRVRSDGVDVGGEAVEASWKAWTPKVGVQYDLNDDMMVYASATRGFKSGGFQLGDGRPFRPEYIWAYEGGVKSMFWDRRLRANLSVFFYDYTDMQVVEYINGVATTTNAGKATLKGGELELQARPVAGLDLTATAAYLDAKYDRFFDQGVSLAGKTLPNAPKWNLTFAAQYRFELPAGQALTLRGDVAWRDEVEFKANNLPQFAGAAYTLFNARATYSTIDDRWELAVFGKNLTDERYATYKTVGTDATGVSNPALPLAVYGEPRQYGVQVMRRF